MSWESVIGLEIHAQLATKSKIFSGAATAYGASPNAQACAVDLGLPGVLPVLNVQAVRMAVMFGLAVDAQIARRCVFARKNYFYPDLPKGYQISQLDFPIVIGGHVMIDADEGQIRQIVWNLATNGLRAMRDGGTLHRFESHSLVPTWKRMLVSPCTARFKD